MSDTEQNLELVEEEEKIIEEEPKVEEPKVEEPKVEEPKVEEPKAENKATTDVSHILDDNTVDVDQNVKTAGNKTYVFLCSCFNFLLER
jgi:hypothetical protein